MEIWFIETAREKKGGGGGGVTIELLLQHLMG